MAVTRREFLKGSVVAGAGLATGFGSQRPHRAAEDAIKIGVLHSLSGTMAISEVSLRDVVLMAVERDQREGRRAGPAAPPVVVDPASNWDLFAEKAKQLLLQTRSPSSRLLDVGERKSVLPVFETTTACSSIPSV